MLRRRELLQSGIAAGAALAFGPTFWRRAMSAAAAPASVGPGPYGPLQPADANGIRLPSGFRSRVIAQATQPVPGTSYVWPIFPDGSATFPMDDGGWVVVVNSEAPPDLAGLSRTGEGGASAIRFNRDGSIRSAYRILSGSDTNCAGGPTPWGTWLSCEERESDGRVFECDPTGQRSAVARLAMGIFKHEAAAVDPVGRRVYLTEDLGDGCFYRFTPASWPDLSAGLLEVATVAPDGKVGWTRIPDPAGRQTPTRRQVPGATQFKRGEGIWHDSGFVYIATTTDAKVHEYNTVLETMDVIYDREKTRDAPLAEVDNVTASRSGDIFVCEDTGDDDPLDIGIITPEGEVARFLKVTGNQHTGAGGDISSELAGVTFDPSGTRMYFSSQRAFGPGVTYEITGPFRTDRVDKRQPGFRLAVSRSVHLGTLEREGIRVRLVVDAAVTVDVLIRVPASGSGRMITIARDKATMKERGRLRLRPKAGSGARRALRGRRFASGTVEIAITDEAGNTVRESRPLRIVVPRTRRRR